MSVLDNMRTRVDYRGGAQQQSRMIKDKLGSLKKALLYSYQAGTMIIQTEDDELHFRCLMNPDKITLDKNKMMLSVPFEDICLNKPRIGKTSEGVVPVPISCGDTFIWRPREEAPETHWLITLQYLDELAYFRADVQKCYPYPLDINGKEYWFANLGENEEIIDWDRHNMQIYNKLNYTRTLYLKRNEETIDYFNRFKIIKVPNFKGELESWEVQAVAPNKTDDVLIVFIKEYFENQFDELNQCIEEQKQENHELNEDLVTYPYERICITVKEVSDAKFNIWNETEGLRFELHAQKNNDGTLTLFIQLLTGNTGSFDVVYNEEIVQHVVVKSF